MTETFPPAPYTAQAGYSGLYTVHLYRLHLPPPPELRHIMKLELNSASNFLVHLVRLARRNVSESQLQKLNSCLIEVLIRRYRDHWFPEKPFKGSGYRCIRINGKMDPLIGQAAEDAGLSAKFLHQIFPSELTLWVDPLEVSYRIGENGSICVLYEYKEGVTEPWRPTLHHANNKNTSNQNKMKQKTPEVSSPTCKDFIRESRSVSIEQLAAFVTS